MLHNKKGLIIGLANNSSIAWGIAQAAHREGAELGFTYLNDALAKRVTPLAQSLGSDLILPCDVNDDQQIDAMAAAIKERWGKLEFVVHAVAFAQRQDLQGNISATSREGFRIALETSAYSLIAVARALTPLMTEGGSMLTLTYYGSEKVVPNYNIMGIAKAALECSVRYLACELGEKNIRVNAISPGAIKTLSAKGIADFNSMLSASKERAPLHRNVTPSDVGELAAFLLSDRAASITGDIIYLDGGYNLLGF
ncbi:enoyl-ACP reductase FabI [bacterium]|nr:enoyl-ACP reductase FabI [bacterium]